MSMVGHRSSSRPTRNGSPAFTNDGSHHSTVVGAVPFFWVQHLAVDVGLADGLRPRWSTIRRTAMSFGVTPPSPPGAIPAPARTRRCCESLRSVHWPARWRQ